MAYAASIPFFSFTSVETKKKIAEKNQNYPKSQG